MRNAKLVTVVIIVFVVAMFVFSPPSQTNMKTSNTPPVDTQPLQTNDNKEDTNSVIFPEDESDVDVEDDPTVEKEKQLEGLDLPISLYQHCASFLDSLRKSDRAEYTFEFEKELDMMLNYITCRIPIALMRYGDGEIALIEGRRITAQAVDRWDWPGGPNKVGNLLKESLTYKHDNENYYAALPCEDWATIVNSIYSFGNTQTRYTSYATVFINRNYQKFKKYFRERIMTIPKEKSHIVMVVNERADISRITWAKEVLLIPDQGIKYFEQEGERVVRYFQAFARAYNQTTFMLSGGPVAKVLVYKMWQANKFNQYIDMGSSLDEFVKGAPTRTYADPNSTYGKHFCKRYRRGANDQLELMPGQ